MDRKEFLITVWKKGIKPILIIGVIFFCVKFLYNIITENGPERFATILILGFGLLILTLSLVGLLFETLTKKVKSILPHSIKLWFRIIGKFLNYISPIVLGMIIYHFWKDDRKTAAVILGVILIQRIQEIIKEEKLDTTQNKPH